MRRKENNKPVIFFELEDNYWHRYLLILCHFLEKEGFQIVIMPEIKFISNWATLELANQLPNVKFYTYAHPNLCISSREKKRKNTKYLSTNYFKSKNSDSEFRIPMPMVDTMYKLKYFSKSKALSKQTRRSIKIFYVGNINKGHETPVIQEYFKILDRNEIVNIILQNFSESIAEIPKSDDELMGLEAEIVIFDRKKLNVKPEILLETLANCQFILAPPGVVMPQTHFIIEAMSVGCIPIIEYPNLFNISLDDSTSLIFNGETDLINKIQYALSMPDVKIKEIRKNVTQFYDKHLSVESVVKNILNPKYQALVLNCENYSVQQVMNSQRD